jgi:hypothetical protein
MEDKMKIDSFSFSSIVIDGKKYNHDILIYADGRIEQRKGGIWRFGSHNIKGEEIEKLLREKPEVVLVGTGTQGRAHLSKDVKTKGAELMVSSSREAVGRFNELIDQGKKVAALIHITC